MCSLQVRGQQARIVSNNLVDKKNRCEVADLETAWERNGKRTEPIDKKNEKVAALLSMYCDSVDRAPRGPAPPLQFEEKPHGDTLISGRN
jgi:hypothetical protein